MRIGGGGMFIEHILDAEVDAEGSHNYQTGTDGSKRLVAEAYEAIEHCMSCPISRQDNFSQRSQAHIPPVRDRNGLRLPFSLLSMAASREINPSALHVSKSLPPFHDLFNAGSVEAAWRFDAYVQEPCSKTVHPQDFSYIFQAHLPKRAIRPS